jgi:hypothetical protein
MSVNGTIGFALPFRRDQGIRHLSRVDHGEISASRADPAAWPAQFDPVMLSKSS